jgi:hypothetical protein
MEMTRTSAADDPRDPLALVAWCTGAALLAWLCALHLGVLANFALGAGVSPALAPLATVAALLAAFRLGRRAGLSPRQGAAAAALAGSVIAAGLALAASFLDLSWDGQWYHQTAIYKMSSGWNPIHEPLRAFGSSSDLWVLHYAKGPWYVALALFATTGSIEVAKAMAGISLVIGFLIVLAAALELGLGRLSALLVALLTALNPVTTCAVVTHQVDAILVSLMASAVAAGLCFCRRPNWLNALVMLLCAVLCINTKFTGLVYLCFFFAGGAVYCFWRQRATVPRFLALATAAILVGTLVFGFNPYVTNTIKRGHPFYPVQGTAAYPGLAQRGRDPIELYETPHNLMGRSRLVRLAYGVFGRPSTAPFVSENAELMWPFAASWRDFGLYYFHDVRISGFGPLFSGVLLLALGLAALGCARRALPCGVLLLLGGTIVASLLVSTHTWWARYGPHLWWLPLILLAAALRAGRPPLLKRAALVIAAVLLADTLIVSAVHTRWEWRSTRALRQQLLDLREAGAMTVDLAYFVVPVAERLRTAGVVFEATRRFECPDDRQLTLLSVCAGYPGAVRICLADAERAAQLRAQPHWQ